MGDVEVLHRLADLFQVGKDLFRGVAKYQRHKFLPTVAGQEIGAALQQGGRGFGHGGDHLVPGRVAEGIVVHLEAVDVEHTDRKGELQPGGLLPLGRAVLLIFAPVGDPGQLVGHGLLLHLAAVVI